MSRPLTEDEFHFACSVNERGRRAQRLGRTRRASRSRRGSGADAPSTGAGARSGYGALWAAAGTIAEGGAAPEPGPTTGKDREAEGGDDGMAGDELLDFGEFVVLEVRFASMPVSLSPFLPLIAFSRVLVVALGYPYLTSSGMFSASTSTCTSFAPASWQVLRLQRITPDDLASMRAIFDTMDTDRSGQVRTHARDALNTREQDPL